MPDDISRRRGWAAGVLLLAAAGLIGAACRADATREDWLQKTFEEGRSLFFETVRGDLARHPARSELSVEETDKVNRADTLTPRLYGILVNLYYQKEEPVFDALREADTPDSRAEFIARYSELVRFAAGNFVKCLFMPGPHVDYIRELLPAFKGKDRVDLVILSTGYHARLDQPEGPAKPVERSPEFDKQWGLDAGRFRDAHRLTRGEGVRIAVLDSGIDAEHPIFRETEFGEHFVLVGREGPPWDERPLMVDWGWHGTIVSSIVTRYAPRARLTMYKAMDADTMNNAPYPLILVHHMAAAIYKAVHDGNDLINISAGAGSDIPYLREACKYARDNNVMIVAASPYYQGRYMGYHVNYPGGYPTTLSVTGIDRREDGSYAYWPIAAPDVTTTIAAPCAPFAAYPTYVPEKDEYAPGISCATPIVTAAAALTMSKYPRTGSEAPGAYYDTIKHLLTDNADARILGYTGFTPECGAGLVNAEKSVRAAERLAVSRKNRKP